VYQSILLAVAFFLFGKRGGPESRKRMFSVSDKCVVDCFVIVAVDACSVAVDNVVLAGNMSVDVDGAGSDAFFLLLVRPRLPVSS
jgi:hypothetical protein